jgi:hypothetical protein
MIAEIFGSIFLVISAVVIIYELNQNLKQRKIQNTFMRTVAFEKIYYKLMEKDFSILVTKGRNSYSEMEDYEKNQFNAYISLLISTLNRADLMASETSYLTGESKLKLRVSAGTKNLFSNPGALEAYSVLKERGVLEGFDNFQKVFDDLKLTPYE